MKTKVLCLAPCDNGEVKSDIYATPPSFFKKLHGVFNFTLDVCANADNKKCDRFYNVEQNGLTQEWDREANTANWANIPYSKKAGWFQKAHSEASLGAVIGLLSTMDSLTNKSFDSKYVSHSRKSYLDFVPFLESDL